MTQDREANTGFLFQKPKTHPDASILCNDLIQLGAMAGRLAQEERTLVKHPDGRAENVAEHTFMLSFVAPLIAMRYYPDLDVGRVSLYALVHDALEAYTGDTPTHDISSSGLAAKAKLERQALEQLAKEYAHIPEFVQLVEAYEIQEDREARLVGALDKCMPYIVHFNQGGQTLTHHWSKEELLENAKRREGLFLEKYPDFPEIVKTRMELVRLAHDTLYQE